MAMRALAGRIRQTGAAAVAAGVGLSSAAYCDSKDVAPSFDPEALERGATALREINKSPYAKKVCGTINLPVIEFSVSAENGNCLHGKVCRHWQPQ